MQLHLHQKLPIIPLLAKCLAFGKHEPDLRFVVEYASNGIPLVAALRGRGKFVTPYDPKYDKQTRAAIVIPVFADKRIVFLRNRDEDDSWIQSIMNETLSFPHGPKDDQVDSLVAGVRYGDRFVAQAWRKPKQHHDDSGRPEY